MTTAEVRSCLSTVFGQDVVHERIYRNLEVLGKRGEAARATRSGRHALWRLTRPHPAGGLGLGRRVVGVLGGLGLRDALGLGGRLGLFPRNPSVAEVCLT
jgi:hypothetical protein